MRMPLVLSALKPATLQAHPAGESMELLERLIRDQVDAVSKNQIRLLPASLIPRRVSLDIS